MMTQKRIRPGAQRPQLSTTTASTAKPLTTVAPLPISATVSMPSMPTPTSSSAASSSGSSWPPAQPLPEPKEESLPVAPAAPRESDITSTGPPPSVETIELAAPVLYTLASLALTNKRRNNKTGKQPRYTCAECGRRFATASNLSRHRQSHDAAPRHECARCDKVYHNRAALAMHVLTHQPRHACRLCGKLFARRWTLRCHLDVHSGQRPFGCAHCGRSFCDRNNLRKHIVALHAKGADEEDTTCPGCGRRFALRCYLSKHLAGEARCGGTSSK